MTMWSPAIRLGPSLLLSCVLLLLCTTPSLTSITHQQPPETTTHLSRGNSSNLTYAQDPLHYVRLQFDQYFLLPLKRYQKKRPSDEKELKTVKTLQGEELESPVTYYTNPHVDISNITEDDLIVETLSRSYQTMFTHNMMYDYDRLEDRRRSSDPKKVSKQRCLDELSYLHDRLMELQNSRYSRTVKTRLHPELATFLDSYGSVETGTLMGNFKWLGYWQQCSRRHIFDIQNVTTTDHDNQQVVKTRLTSFTGRSCVVSIKNPAWHEKISERVRELEKIEYFKYKNQSADFRRYFRVQVGICLPESCDSNIIMDHVMANETLKTMLKTLALHRVQEPFRSYNLTNVYCLPDESSPLRQLDLSAWLFVVVTMTWLGIVSLASVAQHFDLVGTASMGSLDKTLAQKLVISLCLQESYHTWSRVGPKKRKLTPAKSDGGSLDTNGQPPKVSHELKPARPSELNFLHAIKVAILPGIFIGHIALIMVSLCSNAVDYDQFNQFFIHYFGGTSFFVDWYFSITAFITTYTMFSTKTAQEGTATMWIYSIFHRYWRLMPTYLYLFWFSRSVFRYTGRGATWDYGTSTMGSRAVCERESWLHPLALTSNWHPLYEECIMPAWYLGADMQYYLITPLLLITIMKAGKWGYLLPLNIAGSSMLLRAYRFWTDNQVRPVELVRARLDVTMRNNWDMSEAYLLPHYRIASYMVGLMAGHYTYMVRSGQWSSPLYSGPSDGADQMSRAHRWRLVLGSIGTYIACLFLIITWLGDVTFPRAMEPYAKYTVVATYSASFTIASLAPMLISMTLILGLWPRLKEFLEHRCWIWLSRLNYFVFLYQVDVVLWILQNSGEIYKYSYFLELTLFGSLLPLLYVLSFIITILVQNPLARLELELLGLHLMERENKRKKKKLEASPSSASTTEATRLVCLETATTNVKEGAREEQEELRPVSMATTRLET